MVFGAIARGMMVDWEGDGSHFALRSGSFRDHK